MKTTILQPAVLCLLLVGVSGVQSGVRTLATSGADSYVLIGTPPALQTGTNSPLTVEGWVFFSSLDTRDCLYSKNNARTSPYSYAFGVVDNGDLAAYNGFAWIKPIPTPPKVTTGVWHHIAFSYDGTNLAFYLNGILQGTNRFTYTNTPGHTIKIGGYGSGADIAGMISEVRVWNHARSSEDIQALRNWRLKGNEPGLIGYWRLEDGFGSFALDGTSNNSTGALMGAGWSGPTDLALHDFLLANPMTGSTRFINTNQADVLSFPPYTNYTHFQITEGGAEPLDEAESWNSTASPPARVIFSIPSTDTSVLVTAWFTNLSVSVPLLRHDKRIFFTTVPPSLSIRTNVSRSVITGQTLRVSFQPGAGSSVPLDSGTHGGMANGLAMALDPPVLFCPEDETPEADQVVLSTAGVYTVTVTATNEAGNVSTGFCTLTVYARTTPDLFVSLAGNNNGGLDWTSAMTNLQEALQAAFAGDILHVAGGQTFPILTALQWPSVSNLTLRGGYQAQPGFEPGPQNPETWPTILQVPLTTSNRVLTLSGTCNATLDSLTFAGGNEWLTGYGGGVFAANVTGLIIRTCRFIRNRTISGGNAYGGGLAATNCTGLISNCVFIGNFAATTTGHGTGCRGGALYLLGGNLSLRDLSIHGNYSGAGYGGYRNSNFDSAGGIWLGGVGATFQAKNLLIVNNDGGGIMVDRGNVLLENLTVSGNDPSGLSIASTAAGTTLLRNSILYGNRDDFVGSIPTLHFNTIGDGTRDGQDGNNSLDPLFEFPLFYLSPSSPCLDSGTSTVTAAGLDDTTSLTNGTFDTGTVNRGFHFPEGIVWDLNLYVKSGGSGDGSSPDSPLGSITAALALAQPRTRIHVAPGLYDQTTETFPLIITGKTVQLLGTDPQNTILNASGSTRRVVLLQDSPFGPNRLEGLTLKGGLAYLAGHGGGVRVDNAALSLVNCILLQNQTTGNPNYGGGLYGSDGTVEISECQFISNVAAHATGHLDSMGGGLAAGTAIRLRLINSRFVGNITRKSGGTAWSYWGGAVWLGSGQFVLRNLLLTGNIGGGVALSAFPSTANGAPSPAYARVHNLTTWNNNSNGFWVASSATNSEILNSIAWDHPDDFEGALPVLFAFNCIGDGTRNGVEGNFANDPLFRDASGGDFRLRPESPCADAGSNQLWMATAIDLQGLPRILRGRVDIGAYESPPPAGTLILIR